MLEQYCFTHVILDQISPQQFEIIFNFHQKEQFEKDQNFLLEYYRQHQFCKFKFNRICYIELENLIILIERQKINLTLQNVQNIIYEEIEKLELQFYNQRVDKEQIWFLIENQNIKKVIFPFMVPYKIDFCDSWKVYKSYLNHIFDNIEYSKKVIPKNLYDKNQYQQSLASLKINNYQKRALFDLAYEISIFSKEQLNKINNIYNALQEQFRQLKQYLKLYSNQLYQDMSSIENFQSSQLGLWLIKIEKNEDYVEDLTLKFLYKKDLLNDKLIFAQFDQMKPQLEIFLLDIIKVHYYKLIQSNKSIQFQFDLNNNQQIDVLTDINKIQKQLIQQNIEILQTCTQQRLKYILNTFNDLKKQNQESNNLSIMTYNVLFQNQQICQLFESTNLQKIRKHLKKYLREEIFKVLVVIQQPFHLDELSIIFQLLKFGNFNFYTLFNHIKEELQKQLKFSYSNFQINIFSENQIINVLLQIINEQIKQNNYKLKNSDIQNLVIEKLNYQEYLNIIQILVAFLPQNLKLSFQQLENLFKNTFQQNQNQDEDFQNTDQFVQNILLRISQQIYDLTLQEL